MTKIRQGMIKFKTFPFLRNLGFCCEIVGDFIDYTAKRRQRLRRVTLRRKLRVKMRQFTRRHSWRSLYTTVKFRQELHSGRFSLKNSSGVNLCNGGLISSSREKSVHIGQLRIWFVALNVYQTYWRGFLVYAVKNSCYKIDCQLTTVKAKKLKEDAKDQKWGLFYVREVNKMSKMRHFLSFFCNIGLFTHFHEAHLGHYF